MAATGDGDVEHAALLLDVLGQPVGHDAVGDAEHGDAVPLPALHPVDRRERDAVGRRSRAGTRRAATARSRPGRGAGRPRRAGRRGRRGGWSPARRPCGRAGSSPRRARRRRAPPPGRAGSCPSRRRRRRPAGRRPGAAPWRRPCPAPGRRCPTSWASDHRARRCRRSGNHCGRPAGRAAQDLDDVVGAHRVAGGGDAQVGEGGAHAGALEHLGPQHRRHGDAGLVQGDVGRQQQRVDAGQHGDRTTARRPVRSNQPLHDRDERRGAVVAAVLDDPQRARRRVAVGPGIDLLGDPPVVVAEQRAGAVDDLDRAAVVDGRAGAARRRGTAARSR